MEAVQVKRRRKRIVFDLAIIEFGVNCLQKKTQTPSNNSLLARPPNPLKPT